ncbi:MAG: replication initiator [Mycobacteriales bacterium]
MSAATCPMGPLAPAGPDARTLATALERIASPAWPAFAAQLSRVGGCARPVRLRGAVDAVARSTGELHRVYESSSAPDGVALVACKTRRGAICPSCAHLYRGDAYALTSAGLAGGHGVDPAVAAHPVLFATLTAPGFGAVHARRDRGACHPPPRRGRVRTCPHGQVLVCTGVHAAGDPILGAPLCARCADAAGVALFNALAPELWRRTTIATRRALARAAGLSAKAAAKVVRVSFVKVAEFQRRGVVHYHALLRLDGVDPEGKLVPPPAPFDAGLLVAALTSAVAQVRVPLPENLPAPFATTPAGAPRQSLRWGARLDVQVLRRTPAGPPAGEEGLGALRAVPGTGPATEPRAVLGPDPHIEREADSDPERDPDTELGPEPSLADPLPSGLPPARVVAHYLSKYASKGTEDLGAPLFAVRTLATLPASTPAHVRALVAAALALGRVAGFERVARQAHLLGFKGVCLSKSAAWSTTFTALRANRAAWAGAHRGHDAGSALAVTLGATGSTEGAGVELLGSWRYAGSGYASSGDAWLAAMAAARARDNREGAAEDRNARRWAGAA